MVIVFTEHLCATYSNGKELERASYTYSGGKLFLTVLNGTFKGNKATWDVEVNGNTMALRMSPTSKTYWIRQ